MRKILFIINPTAGKGKASRLIPLIKDAFNNEDIGIKTTNSVGHGELISKDAYKEGYTHVISVGGDGTTFEILNGIQNQDLILGVIPAGTGNDFARTIGLPKDPYKVFSIIKEGKTKRVDIGKINDHYFLNVASVGIDAEIAKEIEHNKNYLSGTMAYIFGVFKTLSKYKHKQVQITIDDITYKREIELIAVGNGKYYGGGMMITPFADIEDGLFEICLVNKMSKIKLAFLLPTVFKGKHIHVQDVEIFKGKEVKITSKESLIINADGNIIGTTPANMTVKSTFQDIIVG